VGEANKVRTCQFEGEPHKPQHNNNQRKKNYSVSKAETKTNRYYKSIVWIWFFCVCTSMLKVFVHFELKNNSWNKSFLRKKLLESFIFKFEKKRQEVTVAEIIPNMLSINDKLDSSVWFQKVLFFETFSSNFKSVESSFLLNLKNLSNRF
jgi:hypothetical protein